MMIVCVVVIDVLVGSFQMESTQHQNENSISNTKITPPARNSKLESFNFDFIKKKYLYTYINK